MDKLPVHDYLFVLTDTNTYHFCCPLLQKQEQFVDAKVITIPAGDSAKNLDTLTFVWKELQRLGATRHSLLVNLGGGMVTDLGGFAAATFKRGMRVINIPTTLLAMVDAATGGKTGINFGGLKNEIGVFAMPEEVIIDANYLKTLDNNNLLSGYAEMIKHALLADEKMLADILNFDLLIPNYPHLQEMIHQSVAVKQKIVAQDPLEHGLRKALNLGHTIGHAIESFSLSSAKPLLHGYAVAYGLLGALYLSIIKSSFPMEKMRQTSAFILKHYGRPSITCKDYSSLLSLMHHDKKNVANTINFTLLSSIGTPLINQSVTEKEIEEALDFIREG